MNGLSGIAQPGGRGCRHERRCLPRLYLGQRGQVCMVMLRWREIRHDILLCCRRGRCLCLCLCLCLCRCLGASLTRCRLCIWIFGFCRLSGLAGLLFWGVGVFGFWFGTGLLARRTRGSKSWTCCTRILVDWGHFWRARRRTQTSRRGHDQLFPHVQWLACRQWGEPGIDRKRRCGVLECVWVVVAELNTKDRGSP